MPQRQVSRCFVGFQKAKRDNGGVDAAARIHSSIAGLIMMRNTLPPLASNDLLGRNRTEKSVTDNLEIFVFHRRHNRALRPLGA